MTREQELEVSMAKRAHGTQTINQDSLVIWLIPPVHGGALFPLLNGEQDIIIELTYVLVEYAKSAQHTWSVFLFLPMPILYASCNDIG